MPAYSSLTGSHIERLRRLLGEDQVRTDSPTLERCSRDETEDLAFPPDVVVLPRSREHVAILLGFAHEEKIPVTPRGGGTGLSGGALPVAAGIALSLERLDAVREISTRDQLAVVEAGVTNLRLREAAEAAGLYYPPDPGSKETCFIGGNIAEDAAGPRSLKYGTTRRYVLGLEAVLPDGALLDTGGRNRKDVCGYDLTGLLVGSEGTLAVVTAAILRLLPRPRATLTLIAPFPGLRQAAAAVEEVCAASGAVAACEILSEEAIQAVSRVHPLPPILQSHKAMLLLELDGESPDILLEEAQRLSRLIGNVGGGEILAAQEAAEQRRLWQIREQVAEGVKSRSLYKEVDAVVPRSHLADLVEKTHEVVERIGLKVVCYGHAGDGNLHINLIRGNLKEADWIARRDEAEAAVMEVTVSLGGSITGEHGVGHTQRRHLSLRLAPRAIDLMKALKQTFDPRGILNPHKIFP
jgi:glycolate oxidase